MTLLNAVGRRLVRISAGTQAVLTEVSCISPRSLEANADTGPELLAAPWHELQTNVVSGIEISSLGQRYSPPDECINVLKFQGEILGRLLFLRGTNSWWIDDSFYMKETQHTGVGLRFRFHNMSVSETMNFCVRDLGVLCLGHSGRQKPHHQSLPFSQAWVLQTSCKISALLANKTMCEQNIYRKHIVRSIPPSVTQQVCSVVTLLTHIWDVPG
jgi:hypothetical protein